MDDDTPTHFNVVVLGTGLTESILAAYAPTSRSNRVLSSQSPLSALSKSGYSVLQLDSDAYYGSSWASLSLTELTAWSDANPSASYAVLDPSILPQSHRFSLSLSPALLPAHGPAIEVLVRSKVAAYLQFGILGGVGLWRSEGEVERVPSSKADVFTHPTLSLLEKRRLTKFLLAIAGEGDWPTADVAATFVAMLSDDFSLPPSITSSLAFALTLCSSGEDLASPSLVRLRRFINSIGRYGTSPFLVGHYGGPGDLVGGFSRVCAVWGGGQILGRPIHPLILDAPVGKSVPSASSIPTALPNDSPTTAFGISVSLEPSPAPPTVFTGSRIVSSPSHYSTLFPDASSPPAGPISVHAIIILSTPIPFPAAPDQVDEEEAKNLPDSHLFVFPPKTHNDGLGTVTALQVGSGTFACPEGYWVLYLSAPIMPDSSTTAESLLAPYLASLLAVNPTPSTALFTLFHSLPAVSIPSTPLPPSFLLTRSLPSLGLTSFLATSLDEAAVEAERLFWDIVGEDGKAEGIQFFASEAIAEDE